MKAGEVVFQGLLDGKIQYRVPLFQRTYSWDEDNWQQLWDDLIEVPRSRPPSGPFGDGGRRHLAQTFPASRPNASPDPELRGPLSGAPA